MTMLNPYTKTAWKSQMTKNTGDVLGAPKYNNSSIPEILSLKISISALLFPIYHHYKIQERQIKNTVKNLQQPSFYFKYITFNLKHHLYVLLCCFVLHQFKNYSVFLR